MENRTLTAVSWLAAAVTTAAALAGCGSSGTTATPNVGIAGLRSIFQHAKASQKTVLVTAHGQEGPDWLGQNCQVQYLPTTASACWLTRRDEHMGLISLPDACYVSMVAAGEDDTWRKLDPHDTDMSDFSGVLAQLVGSQAGIDDDVVLSPGVSRIVDATSDTVDGRSATRYDLAVDGRALYQAMASQVGSDSFREALLDLAHNAGKTAAQIWIGADNLPLRQVIREPPGPYGPGEPETIGYSGWGEPVDIQPPAANHVTR